MTRASEGRLAAAGARVRASERYPRRLLQTCLMGMFSTTFTATILTVSLKKVAADLHSTPAVLAWVITAPVLAQAVAMPILGRVGDMRGHRRVYLTGFSLAILLSICTAFAWDAASLITLRTLAQLAGASTVPASFAMLFQAFPPEERVRASAWASGTLSAASVSGLAIGGVLIDTIGWRSLFFIQAGLSLAALIPAMFVLAPDTHLERVPLDRLGALMLAIAAFSLSFGLNRLATLGLHPIVVGLALTFPVAVWLLVRVERRAEAPILPLHLLKRRDVRVAGATAFFSNGSHMSNYLVTPLLLQSVFGYSATTTSLITISRTVAISASAPSAARVGMRVGEKRLSILGALGMVVAVLMLAVGAGSKIVPLAIFALAASGVAFGHLNPSVVAMAGNAVDAEHFGLATSLQQTAGQIGGVTGMSIVSAVVGSSAAPGRFALAYLLAAVFALGALLVTGGAYLRRSTAAGAGAPGVLARARGLSLEPGTDAPEVAAGFAIAETLAEEELVAELHRSRAGAGPPGDHHQ